ncbi:MAG: amidohydrolase [Planctomycetes bacterium]|nr:amidohydrolase [Planctomycetota bacterium]
MTRPALCLALLLLVASSQADDRADDPPADLVLRGGVVHTLDPARPKAGAVAVRGDRIVGVADAPQAGWIGSGTRVVDLDGACVVPGLWDAHGHLLSLGLADAEVDLTGARSFAEVVERVAARANDVRPGEWVVGRGWDQNLWPKDEFGGEFPTHERLSQAVPGHPVSLSRVDGHATLLNARALAAHGIGPGTASPPGGEVVKDAQGRPTGVLVDAAMALAPEPAPSPAQTRAALRAAARECVRYGLVGVHDAGVTAGSLAMLEELARAGELPLRVYAMLSESAATGDVLAAGPRVNLHGRLTVRAIKTFVDGALGSRGAWLLEPYADRPDARGLPQQTQEELEALLARAARYGFQVCAHAIGDAAVRRVLDAVERVEADLGRERVRAVRPRIEHAQVVHPADVERFGPLGVIPSMQPTHATSDMGWAEARLGPERVRSAYAWQTLLEAGAPGIACGSDFPVEGVSPLWGLHAAVTRVDADGKSPHGSGGWFPHQRLTREQALLGFTRWACAAAFMEEDGGAITVGRWADLAVFDRDLLTCEPAALRALEARLTIVGGRVVHEAPPR